MSGRRTPCCDNSCYSAGKKRIDIFACDNPKCWRSEKKGNNGEANWWCDHCTPSKEYCPSCGEVGAYKSNAG